MCFWRPARSSRWRSSTEAMSFDALQTTSATGSRVSSRFPPVRGIQRHCWRPKHGARIFRVELRTCLNHLCSSGTELFYHTVSALHSPLYRSENSGALRQDWPRVPLPDSRELLEASAALGRQIAALLDPETPVEGVTTGVIRPELHSIAVISRVGGGALNPDAGDLELTAAWGHGGKGGVTMPGKGRAIQRNFAASESACPGFGDSTFDVYLNDVAYWRHVPLAVWEYTLGGYQVIKKWLSYREKDLLGRSLTRRRGPGGGQYSAPHRGTRVAVTGT